MWIGHFLSMYENGECATGEIWTAKKKQINNFVVHVTDFNPIAHLIITDNETCNTNNNNGKEQQAQAANYEPTEIGMPYYLGSNTYIYRIFYAYVLYQMSDTI